MTQKALFLDRDGVINVDKGYVYQFKDIIWVEGIFDLISYANKEGLLVIVLTNQSGVAKGMYQEDDVILLHRQMDDFLRSKKLFVTDWFYCIDDSGFRRKPNPGMMIEACHKYQINLKESFMVGDKVSDVLNIDGPKTYLLKGNYPLESIAPSSQVKKIDSLHQVLEELNSEER